MCLHPTKKRPFSLFCVLPSIRRILYRGEARRRSRMMIIYLGQRLPDCLDPDGRCLRIATGYCAEGYVERRNHRLIHTPNSSLHHHEFTYHVLT